MALSPPILSSTPSFIFFLSQSNHPISLPKTYLWCWASNPSLVKSINFGAIPPSPPCLKLEVPSPRGPHQGLQDPALLPGHFPCVASLQIVPCCLLSSRKPPSSGSQFKDHLSFEETSFPAACSFFVCTFSAAVTVLYCNKFTLLLYPGVGAILDTQ